MIRGKLGDGKQIRFWLDTWLCDEPIKNKFPNLFALEKNKRVVVADRIRKVGAARVLLWEWRRSNVTTEEIQEKQSLEVLLQGVSIEDRYDSWEWSDGRTDGFSVAAVKNWMRGSFANSTRFGFKWCKWVPLKCNIFMWRAFLDRLPTKTALLRRSIQVDNQFCVWCECKEETVEHLFTGCGISAGVWHGISRWCRIRDIFAFHVKDLVDMHEVSGVSGNKKMVLHGVIIIACWRLWRARNDTVFSRKEPNVVEIIADIKILGFLWYNNRFKHGVVDWDRWCNFDVM
ncbi:hypothetical protein L1987_08352 [Smallanthus sonchifolius]|uniref:Uncharacterized protein n=1 Tax=Smallanthus sonchifolius TaxID=185202 RepID=A0ACB9JKU1_9ASTR|nr:hypothetical protein L1987_08352 [Smallanthus sonchifolius]